MNYEVKTLLGIFTSFKKTTVVIFMLMAVSVIFDTAVNQSLTVFGVISYLAGMAVLILAFKLLCAFVYYVMYKRISYKGSLGALIFVFFALMTLATLISVPALNALSELN